MYIDLSRIPLLFVLLFTFFFTACSEPPATHVDVVRPVKMITIGSEHNTTVLEYPGNIAAGTEADIAFEVGGKLVELPIQEGMDVQKGDLLAKLDSRDFESNVKSLKSEYETAQSNFERGGQLLKDNFISQAEYDRLKNIANTAESNYEKAVKALEDTEMRAPFSGQIADKYVENFTNVAAGQRVISLHNQTSLEIDINIPERDWQYARQDETEEEFEKRATPVVVVSTFPDRKFPARFKGVSTIADETTRTYKATLAFDSPPDIVILSGMTAKAIMNLTQDISGLVTIPTNAVGSDAEGNSVVWQVNLDSMTVKRKVVEIGEIVGEKIEVLKGIELNETIVVSGINQLREGMQVSRYQSKK